MKQITINKRLNEIKRLYLHDAFRIAHAFYIGSHLNKFRIYVVDINATRARVLTDIQNVLTLDAGFGIPSTTDLLYARATFRAQPLNTRKGMYELAHSMYWELGHMQDIGRVDYLKELRTVI